MQKATSVINHNISDPWRGLRRNITPCFGSQLVHLYYLADCASIAGTFNDADLCHLDQVFPVLPKPLKPVEKKSTLKPRNGKYLLLE